MTICYFDAFSGISGDMTVGALVDAGADWGALEASLRSLSLPASYTVQKTTRYGIAASKFAVSSTDAAKHRHLPQIQKTISSADLSERARENALAVFNRLAEAEAKSHDVPLERVHFHEVGAVDSISDIVGACVALDLLGVEEVHCSKINVGRGTVNTQHGVLPVPAPATAELLKKMPIYASGPETELTTPTGAALMSTLARSVGEGPSLRVGSQGFGAGDKDFSMQANVLRVLVGEKNRATEDRTVTVIEANIDDSSPQILGYTMERLLDAGALDVTLQPLFMKKNRPGTLISVMAAPERTESLTQILFAETSTLGVRMYDARRRVLERAIADVDTAYGRIRIKTTENGSFAPEYEDCRKAAAEHGIPLRTVIAEAANAYRGT